MLDNEKLLHVVKLGVQMRSNQKAYFKDRTRDRLIESKKAESAFDKAAAELGLPANLWGGG